MNRKKTRKKKSIERHHAGRWQNSALPSALILMRSDVTCKSPIQLRWRLCDARLNGTCLGKSIEKRSIAWTGTKPSALIVPPHALCYNQKIR